MAFKRSWVRIPYAPATEPYPNTQSSDTAFLFPEICKCQKYSIGIYEEGTPEQIFDHPQRDLTKRFVRKLKVLEFKVDDPYFDFAGAGTQIDRYCLENDISSHTKYRIRLAFEELTSAILRPVLGHVPVLITVEYSEKDGNTEVTALYGGEMFDPEKNGDGFSYKVLRSTVSSLAYRYDPEAEQANTVSILI